MLQQSAAATSVVVIVVSDTANSAVSADHTGPALSRYLADNRSFRVHSVDVVPDEVDRIRDAVLRWTDGQDCVDLVLTAGGTGFAPRDRTPEAVSPLLERLAPGLVHRMLSASLDITPFGALSRPIAGVRNRSLIVTLPGSPKAATENLDAIQPILGHAIELMLGLSGQNVHSSLVAPSMAHRMACPEDSNEHVCPNFVRQPSKQAEGSIDNRGIPCFAPLSVTQRHRISPYPLVSLSDALKNLLASTPVLSTEQCPVDSNLLGRVLAHDVVSCFNVPSRPSANVDGYAVCVPLPAGTYPVVSAPSFPLNEPLPSLTLFRINTGAPLPAAANSVIMVEDTHLAQTVTSGNSSPPVEEAWFTEDTHLAQTVTSSNGCPPVEEAWVTTLVDCLESVNVRLPGSDVRSGELVLSAGQLISATGGEISTLAFVGRSDVTVHKLPRIAVLSTGNELVDISQAPTHKLSGQGQEEGSTHHAFDCNRPAIMTALAANRFPASDEGIIVDSYEGTTQKLRDLVDRFDVVITSGGTSMGEADFLKPVIERQLNGKILFGRVSMKPGKPTTVALVPKTSGSKPSSSSSSSSSTSTCLVFALPGNPASCLVTLHVFVLPALRKLAGMHCQFWHLPTFSVKVQSNITLDSRPEYQRAVVRSALSNTGGHYELVADRTGDQRSSRANSLASANALLTLPSASMGHNMIKAGSQIEAMIIGPIFTSASASTSRE